MSAFLDTLWGNPTYRYGELRIIHNGKVEQRFYEIGVVSLSLAESDAAFYDQAGHDVYFGVLPRIYKMGTADACVSETHVLWADVDSKHFDGGKASALFALGRAQLTPSILVDSGNGWHAYWLLRDYVPFEDASQVMKGLAKAIGGDAVYDASRVLRLPSTHNHKTDPPHPVRLLHFEPSRRYRFSDFDAYVPVDHPPARAVTLEEPLPWESLPDWLRDLVIEGAPKGTRSEQAFKACVWLLRFGWSETMIHALFATQGIGEKMREKKDTDGDRWLDRTIRKAREAV